MKPPNKICLFCETPYRVKPYLLPTSKYCSRSCLAKDARQKINATCLICHTTFTHISSRCNKAKYCSTACYNISQRNKGKTTYTCQHCGQSFIGHSCHKRKFCSKQCNGKTSASEWSPKFTTVRKKMLKSNMITACNRCGYDKEPRILGVHHKDRNRLNNEISNLEVLCPNCHSLEHLKHINHGFTE